MRRRFLTLLPVLESSLDQTNETSAFSNFPKNVVVLTFPESFAASNLKSEGFCGLRKRYLLGALEWKSCPAAKQWSNLPDLKQKICLSSCLSRTSIRVDFAFSFVHFSHE